MQLLKYRAYPQGEDVLFKDSDDHLDAARTALSHKNDPKLALDEFLKAYEAQARRDVINEIHQNAQYLARQPQHNLLMAEYYLAVAEHTRIGAHAEDPKLFHPSLEAALAAIAKEEKGPRDRFIDHARIGKIAIGIFHLSSGDEQGGVLRWETLPILNRQINAMVAKDKTFGSNTAASFFGEVALMQIERNFGPSLSGIIDGYIEQIFVDVKDGAPVRTDADHIKAWMAAANNNKPYLQ